MHRAPPGSGRRRLSELSEPGAWRGDGSIRDRDRAVVVVALVARALVPALPWAAAIALGALRANGTVGDAAFQCVEEELDWAQLLRAEQRPDAAVNEQ